MKRAATSSLSDTGKGAKRQASLAGFLKPRPPATAQRDEDDINGVGKGKGKERAVITLDDDSPTAPLKSALLNSEPQPSTTVDGEKPQPLVKPTPSYRPPPSPDYNHPFPIPPPPSSLVLEYNTTPKIITDPSDLDLLYFTRFISPSCSRQLTKYLLDSLPWYRVKYTVRGISINTPRYTTVFGKDSTPTPWSGYTVKPRAIPPILLRLKEKVEEVTGESYNFTLVNYYSSGDDSISYHSDSESFLGPNPCIASLSLGDPRDFVLRHVKYQENKLPVQKFSLHDGDMVVMRGRTQHCWQHSIPKRKHADGRINITFRKGVVAYATKNYNQYNVGDGPMYRWDGSRMVQQT